MALLNQRLIFFTEFLRNPLQTLRTLSESIEIHQASSDDCNREQPAFCLAHTAAISFSLDRSVWKRNLMMKSSKRVSLAVCVAWKRRLPRKFPLFSHTNRKFLLNLFKAILIDSFSRSHFQLSACTIKSAKDEFSSLLSIPSE